jgi:hypothetical protein
MVLCTPPPINTPSLVCLRVCACVCMRVRVCVCVCVSERVTVMVSESNGCGVIHSTAHLHAITGVYVYACVCVCVCMCVCVRESNAYGVREQRLLCYTLHRPQTGHRWFALNSNGYDVNDANTTVFVQRDNNVTTVQNNATTVWHIVEYGVRLGLSVECTLLLHCWYTAVTLLLHSCYTLVTLLLHCCYTAITLFLQCRCTVLTLILFQHTW